MEASEIKNRIRSTMSLVFEVPEGEIDENSSSDTIDNWDSLRHLNLVLALEEEFGISLPDEEVGNMVNFKIAHLIVSEALANGKG